MTNDLFDLTPEEELPPSRSQVKREVEALQSLGERLVTLRKDQLDQMPISDTLRAAVDEAKRLSARSAIRRQM